MVRSILLASIDHHELQFEGGKATLPAQPYADVYAGLAAFNDPSSGASRLADWRSSRCPRGADFSYRDEYAKAARHFTEGNEPDALGEWDGALDEVDGNTTDWWNVAVKWQVEN